MASTRELIVEAAMSLVGERGVTALTHRRVDARAGLPTGSTSNYFRTKAALLQGAIEGVLVFELPLVTRIRSADSGEALTDALAEFVTQVTQSPLDVVSAARLALFLEARHDADLRAGIAAGRQAHRALLESVLEPLGAVDPVLGAQLLVTVVEGAIVDRVTCVPDEDLTQAIAVAVAAALEEPPAARAPARRSPARP